MQSDEEDELSQSEFAAETDEGATTASNTKYHKGFEQVVPFCQSSKPRIDASDFPYPRSGHRLLANDRYAISVGGFNPSLWNEHNTGDTYYPILKEIWMFNFATLRWKKLATTSSMPKELASHAALLHDNHVLVYGGTGVPFGHSSTNHLHALNMKNGTWCLQPTRAAAGSLASMPPEQYGHAFVRHGSKFYVIGGTSGFQYNMQVFELSLDHKDGGEWRSLLRGAEASPRYRHEAFYFAGKLHVLGGGTSTSVCSLEHVDVFDISSGKWSEKQIQQDPENGFPSQRRCHGLAVNENAASSSYGLSVYISGGFDGETAYSDVWELKVSCDGGAVIYAWRKFPHDLPRPLYFHGMAITPSGGMLIFGGVDGTTDKRSSLLYRCLLSPPSLLEQSLRKVLSNVGESDEKRMLEAAKTLQLPERCMEWLQNRW